MDDCVRRKLAEGEHLEVFRLVHVSTADDDALAEDMKSNAARGRSPRGRESRHPEIHRGLSVFKKYTQAAERRRQIAARLQEQGSDQPVKIGDYVARLTLEGPGVGYEDRDEPDGHMTIWGDPLRLAGAVTDLSPAERNR